ncbi:MAG TPA: nitrite reductase small subunit NirD [Vicinamibacterales bacterium]|jgi:nitrite reductase (NADH) small subunit
MSDWVQVARAELIPPREGRAVRIGAREIAVFNLGEPSTELGAGGFLATDNRCPHKGGPLCDGIVTGRSVVCPLHAWKISLESGAVERPGRSDACVPTHPVRVEDGIVMVLLPADGRDQQIIQDCQIVQA